MKDYLNQFYNEGFATTFYQKPIKYVDKHMKGNKILIKSIIKVIYTICAVCFAILMFIANWPL